MVAELPKMCKLIGHSFRDTLVPGDECDVCGIIYCPVAYDHDPVYGDSCAVCGWENEGGAW